MILKSILLVICIVTIFIVIKIYTPVEPHVKASPHFVDGKFQNTVQPTEKRSFGKLFKFLVHEKWGKWPKWVENEATPDLQTSDDEVVVTFINHATFLLELENTRVLFDPMFSKRAGPFNIAGPKRVRAPGLALQDLPPIDLVLITHNHYDHLDLPSLRAINKRFKPKIIVPLGVKKMLKNKGFKDVVELDWWQHVQFHDCTKISLVPAQHSSGRTLFDRDKTFWGGFVVEHPGATVYHAGDTGYSTHFKEIGERFDIDIAMLSIGDYEPGWFLEYVHMTPEQAVKAHQEVGSSQSFSMHSDTFSLSALDYLEAEATLQKALKNNANLKPFTVLQAGASFKTPAKAKCKITE